MASHATKMVREMGTLGEPMKTAGIENPTDNEIALVAYRLWLDSGCPIGSDKEHWSRAEAMLRNAFVAKREHLFGHPSHPRCDIRTESATMAEFTLERWDGHWEIWEREWNCARWVWDMRSSGARAASQGA